MQLINHLPSGYGHRCKTDSRGLAQNVCYRFRISLATIPKYLRLWYTMSTPLRERIVTTNRTWSSLTSMWLSFHTWTHRYPKTAGRSRYKSFWWSWPSRWECIFPNPWCFKPLCFFFFLDFFASSSDNLVRNNGTPLIFTFSAETLSCVKWP